MAVNTHPGATATGGGDTNTPAPVVDYTTRTSVQNTNTTQRRYIDVPTPEEFLDDFQNAFAGHLANAVQGGQMNHQQAAWAAQHASQFLDQYTGKLAQMAASGQQIFKAFLPAGQPQLLGSRAGDYTNTQQGGNTTTNNTNVNQPRPGAPTTVGGGPTPPPNTPNQFGAAPIGAAATGGVQTSYQAATGASSTGGATATGPAHPGATAMGPGAAAVGGGAATPADAFNNTNTQQYGTNNTTEDIYGRPQIGTLHTYSPTQFLQDNVSPDSMAIAYEGQKGESQYARDKSQRVASGTRVVS